MYVYSFLTYGLKSGHLILDDSYWISFFQDRLLGLYTSKYSCDVQVDRFPEFSGKYNVIKDHKYLKKVSYKLNTIFRCSTVPVPSKEKILIQAYEEFSIIFFIIRAKIKGNKIYLISTNNISNNRVNSERWFLKGLLKIIFILSDVVFYHNQHEKKLIDRFIISFNESKFAFRKYQLLRADPLAYMYRISYGPKMSICFFGPIKFDKPIQPFLDLIKADKENKFLYKIYNPGENLVDDLIKKFNDNQNVEIVNKFLSFEEYDKAVKDSAIIFLSHDSSYEGKLSGNICDCISKRKPFISNNISPVKDFVMEYGQIGFVYDLGMDSTWTSAFLNSIDEGKYNSVLKNLERLQLDFTDEKIKQELDLVFNK